MRAASQFAALRTKLVPESFWPRGHKQDHVHDHALLSGRVALVAVGVNGSGEGGDGERDLRGDTHFAIQNVTRFIIY